MNYNARMIRQAKIILLTCVLAFSCALQGSVSDSRTLEFLHTHTGESLKVTYYSDGTYRPEAMSQVRSFLADWRNQEQQDIDPELLDILWQLKQVSGVDGAFEVISAYRSPATNDMLRKKSSGVASKSQHLLGKAIDVRLRGAKLAELHQAARDLKLGGVGYYPGSDFIHVDTGRVRYW